MISLWIRFWREVSCWCEAIWIAFFWPSNYWDMWWFRLYPYLMRAWNHAESTLEREYMAHPKYIYIARVGQSGLWFKLK